MKRKLAEFLSLTFSALVLVSLFGYLIYDGVAIHTSDILTVSGEALTDQIKKNEENFILPVVVKNEGDKTPSVITFKLKAVFSDHTEEKDFEVEYLMKRNSKKIYILFQNDPAAAKITVHPETYQF